MSQKNVKLFISYSWSSKEREEWVINLASSLREDGVDVVLDKWDLREGQDAYKFMEKMVSDEDVKKVIIVSDKTYVDKADSRTGGVGTETQIITPKIYQEQDQTKFVAVVAEKDTAGKPWLPIYYQSRIFIDLSDDDLYAQNYEQLLRWIYNEPVHIKPPLGNKPAFLAGDDVPTLETSAFYRKAMEAIRSDKTNWMAAVQDYFEQFASNLENFRLSPGTNNDIDDRVVQNIEQFLPYRNEAIELFLALARYRDENSTAKILHEFFEKLIPFLFAPEGIGAHSSWDFDNFRFIIHELFLYCIASLIKYERFALVERLLKQQFFTQVFRHQGKTMVHFSTVHESLPSLEQRSRKTRRLSVRADLLEERSKVSGLPFVNLMQADFVLFLRGLLDRLRETESRSRWWPETLLYACFGPTRIFEIFSRAQSREYLNAMGVMLGVSKKSHFDSVIEGLKTGKIRGPSWQFESPNIEELMNYENLGTKE